MDLTFDSSVLQATWRSAKSAISDAMTPRVGGSGHVFAQFGAGSVVLIATTL